MSRRGAGLAFALASVVAVAAAASQPEPVDWDPAYYLTVARHVARGDGAVTGAVWTLGWLPDALPFPADLHWMPLPSRVFALGELVWPGVGGRAIAALLAAAWAPLAWAAAARVAPDAKPLAAALAAFGCGYAGWVALPDSGGLYGVIGSLALLAAADGRAAPAAGLAMAAALTRNDGFLLAPCLAWPVWTAGRRGPALAVAAAGPLATAAWTARCYAIGGPGWLAARRALSNVTDTESLQTLTLGGAAQATLADRLAFLATEGVVTALLIAVFAMPFPWLFGLRGRDPLTRATRAYAVVLPVVGMALAPGIAASGSVFRSSTAIAPVACALAAGALVALGRWGQRVRGYHPAFLPTLALAIVVGASGLVAAPRILSPRSPLPSDACAALAGVPAGAPVFTAQPLLLEAHCDHPAVLLAAPMTAEGATALAARYHVAHALVYATGDTMAVTDAALPALLPGWTEATPRQGEGPRLFVAPP